MSQVLHSTSKCPDNKQDHVYIKLYFLKEVKVNQNCTLETPDIEKYRKQKSSGDSFLNHPAFLALS